MQARMPLSNSPSFGDVTNTNNILHDQAATDHAQALLMQSGSTEEQIQVVDMYLQSSGHCPVHQQDSIVRHLVLESELSGLSETGGHQLWPPLQVGQGHMLQGQTVRLLKMLHCGECIAAPPLHGRLFAEVKVVHGAVAERIHMVQAGTLRQQTVINGWMWCHRGRRRRRTTGGRR